MKFGFFVALATTWVGVVVLAQDNNDNGATTTTEQQQQQPAAGCFDFRGLTCNVPLESGDAAIDVNTACLAMEQQIKRNTGVAVGLYKSPHDAALHQAALSHLSVDDPLCYGAHNAYHKCWWCAPVALANPDDKDPEQEQDFSNVVDDWFCQFRSCEKPNPFDETVDLNATCTEMQAVKDRFNGDGYPATIEFCLRAQYAAHQCPDVFCNQEYLGANTIPKKRAMVWMSRVSALLSMMGACYILYDIASDKKNRKTVYHQLLFGMAIFDVFTALAWGFATAPIPKEKFWVEGAIGNEATCTTQAFFIQLGFTSVFYNVSLALYYVLVIVHDYREHTLMKLRPYLHGGPLAVGILLAFAGLPFYDWFEYGCHLLPPPDGEMWVVLFFAVGPLGLAIASIASSMMIVYCKVRRQARTSKKWSFGVGTSSTLERQVFYQSVWYVLSFLVSWPILFAVYLASVDADGPYGLTIVIAFVAPLQGFNNALVYIRPKINQYRKNKARAKAKKNKITSGHSSSATVAGGSNDGSFNIRQAIFGMRRKESGRATGRFSFLRFSSASMSSSEVERNSTAGGVGMRFSGVSQLGNSRSDASMSEFSANNSISLNEPSRAETEQTFQCSAMSLDTIDPSVLIAREDREDILDAQKKQEEQEEQEQAPPERTRASAKPSHETIEEMEFEDEPSDRAEEDAEKEEPQPVPTKEEEPQPVPTHIPAKAPSKKRLDI